MPRSRRRKERLQEPYPFELGVILVWAVWLLYAYFIYLDQPNPAVNYLGNSVLWAVYRLLGDLSYATPIILLPLPIAILSRQYRPFLIKLSITIFIVVLHYGVFAQVLFGTSGAYGQLVVSLLDRGFGRIGGLIVVSFSLIFVLTLLFLKETRWTLAAISNLRNGKHPSRKRLSPLRRRPIPIQDENDYLSAIPEPEKSFPPVGELSIRSDRSESRAETVKDTKDSPTLPLVIDEEGQIELPFPDLSVDYRLPSLNLLNDPPEDQEAQLDTKTGAEVIERTLANFSIEAKVVFIQQGPRVTRYEITIGPGINVNRIHSLADNLALELAVTSVRIEAPVPGKSAVGIEVPNKRVQIITIKELLESDPIKRSNSYLVVGLGKDISGKPIVGDLPKMPHLLIAGATGSGKSVCLNTIIISLLYRCSPDVLKLILIDPKRVEMTPFADLPHLITPIVHDPKEAESALRWITSEMDRRYRLFASKSARNIIAFNDAAPEEERLPYIVLIIDELADLMMLTGPTIERLICRIAQLARATGIHLVVATQRPDVKVITGTIKANIPSRVAFAVVSQIDSRTILDSVGAEKLLGFGDMLFSPVGVSRPFRVQGAFVSDREIFQVTNFIKAQRGPRYMDEVIRFEDEREEEETGEVDELYPMAKEIVLTTGRASASFLQRRLRIGYNRAARIMEALENEGLVTEPEGIKGRRLI